MPQPEPEREPREPEPEPTFPKWEPEPQQSLWFHNTAVMVLTVFFDQTYFREWEKRYPNKNLDFFISNGGYIKNGALEKLPLPL